MFFFFSHFSAHTLYATPFGGVSRLLLRSGRPLDLSEAESEGAREPSAASLASAAARGVLSAEPRADAFPDDDEMTLPEPPLGPCAGPRCELGADPAGVIWPLCAPGANLAANDGLFHSVIIPVAYFLTPSWLGCMLMLLVARVNASFAGSRF